MKRLDRYILGKFLRTFLFSLVLFTVVVVMIDISEKTDDFVKSKLPALTILTDYYFGFIPRIDAMLFPLFVFISVIFFTAKMADRSEVIAILASGVSLRRFLLPYWIGSIFLGLILWIGNQYFLPKANAIWGAFDAKYLDFSPTPNGAKAFPQNFYFRIDSHTYAGIRYYDTVNKSGGMFFVQRFDSNTMTYNLRADNINWDSTGKKWKLNRVAERVIGKDEEDVQIKFGIDTAYNFGPQDLRRDEYLKDRLNTPDLDRLIALERLRGSEGINTLLIERYNRDAIPVSVIILALIGGTLASRKVRGGSGMQLAIGIVLSVLYILLGRFSLVFATKGNFPALLAAWLPNMIFACVAYYLYRRAAR